MSFTSVNRTLFVNCAIPCLVVQLKHTDSIAEKFADLAVDVARVVSVDIERYKRRARLGGTLLKKFVEQFFQAEACTLAVLANTPFRLNRMAS